MASKDRLSKLLDPHNTKLNGIDFVEVANTCQTTLRVHFLNKVAVAGTLAQGANPTITGGETISTVRVLPFGAGAWSHDPEGRPLFTIKVAAPGDFSFYTLTIDSSALDPFYNRVTFSFKARCPSDLDCEAPPASCPPPAGNPPPITYMAKDFLSFKKALADFSALRYPAWQERSEADFGVMFMEALCSLADDLSYFQDRIANEARIDTATERRSIVRLARLVDYEPQPATSSSVLLQFDVTSGPIPSGLLVHAPGPDGSSIDFETGTGLLDPVTFLIDKATYPVSPAWNRGIQPYYWDDSQSCLPAGSTEMWVLGQGYQFYAGQALLIDTRGLTTADKPLREIFHLTSANEETDPLFNDAVTHLVWSSDEALQLNHDLTSDTDGTPHTILAGNLVPATQGRRYAESFAIDQAPPGLSVPLAIERTGPNASAQYLYTLQNSLLTWLLPAGATAPLPELALIEQPQDKSLPPVNWTWRGTLLDAQEFEQAYTVDPMSYIKIANNSDGSAAYEYDGDSGATIRFGDDVFGGIPDSGSVFQVTYRIGGGSSGNVAPDSITQVDTSATSSLASLVTAVTNPFAAAGGADQETNEQVLRRAPQAFRAVQYRAVTVADYQAAAQTLPWVLRAGTRFRWTGSWLTVFTTADPAGTEQIAVDEQIDLINLLNRYRMAGYESYVPAPDYVGIDLTVTVCALPTAFRGDAEAAIVAALSDSVNPDGATGFFYLDRFTFGTPLERSALEAAIQSASGVAGVVSIQYRQRGITPNWTCLPETLQVGPSQILRMDNDPSRPERGTLRVVVEGGK
jgi:hypothetical protein